MSKLLNALIEFRDAQARREGVEDYKVLQYKTIEEIARVWPKSLVELSQIKGIGPAKLRKYGERILELVEENVKFTKKSEISKQKSKAEEHSVPTHLSDGQIYRPDNAAPVFSRTLTPTPLPAGEGEEKQTVTVSEYLDYLNLVFKKTADVKILGEISRLDIRDKAVYLTLLDKVDGSVLDCVVWRSVYMGLGLPLEAGIEITVEGVPNLYKAKGRFSLVVSNIELAGEGALRKAYEILKAKLESDGLFSRKRELPEFISSIGIITSKNGAVIHDFRNNLAKLGIKIFLKDVRVEGANAAKMVAEGVKWFNGFNPHPSPSPEGRGGANHVDVLVIMRGGGSLEDLQSFNSEAVARAVFASDIPTIVAIGHDKDVPLAQLVADIMVSTPTAAAHAVNATWSRLTLDLPRLEREIVYNYSEVLGEVKQELQNSLQAVTLACGRIAELGQRTQRFILERLLQYQEWTRVRLLNLSVSQSQILGKFTTTINFLENKLDANEQLVANSSPERNLKLGYSLVRNLQGKVVRSVNQISTGERLSMQLTDGYADSEVIRVKQG